MDGIAKSLIVVLLLALWLGMSPLLPTSVPANIKEIVNIILVMVALGYLITQVANRRGNWG